MRIAIIYNDPTHAGAHEAAEFGVLDEVEPIVDCLAGAGHETSLFAVREAGALCQHLKSVQPDVVFNCCEAFRGDARLEANVAALVELLGIACTGSPALALGLALDKHLAKIVFEGHGIRTPAHVVATPENGCHGWQHLQFPLIVKPVAEDASIGIDDGAVVDGAAAMFERVRRVWREHAQAALVEEFIDGREFNVSLLARPGGNFDVLPIGEIRFDSLPRGRRRVLDYDAKWNPAATFRQTDVALCPARLDLVSAARMARLAIDAATALGARDYARVELRQREDDGEFFVIEVNPNPDLSDGCEFLRSARAAGIGNDATIQRIAACAAARIHSTDDYHERNDQPVPSPARAVFRTARQR